MNTFDNFVNGYITEALAKIHDESGTLINYSFGAQQLDMNVLSAISYDCVEFYLEHFETLKREISRENGISFYRARNKRGQAFTSYGYADYKSLYEGARRFGRSKLILARNGKLRLSP